jgi:hypothetical protein
MLRCIAGCWVVMVFAVGCHDDHSTPTPPVVPPPAPTAAMAPSPSLKPEQVVRIVTEALGHNDSPTTNAGIAQAFAFASPGNRQVVGPLARFVLVVKDPMYRALIDYVKIDYAPIRVQGNVAQQLVTVVDDDGEPAAFLWILARQTDGEYKDCWMTDGVTRLGAEDIAPDPDQRRQQQQPPDLRV